jgi:hypothetical protein
VTDATTKAETEYEIEIAIEKVVETVAEEKKESAVATRMRSGNSPGTQLWYLSVS